MRIVGGRLGGRRFAGPSGSGTRPTSERVREALASALVARGAVEGAHVLDLFAGTGALGFEMLSRGAARLVAVDASRRVVRALERSASELGVSDDVRAVALDLLGDPAAVAARLGEIGGGEPFSLVMADPPYAEVADVPDLLRALRAADVLTTDALFVLEHATRAAPELGPGLASIKQYQYGDTSIQLLESPP